MKTFELTMTDDMVEKIEDLAKRSDCNNGVLLQKALMVLEAAIESREAGKFIGITDVEENLTDSFKGI